jgi:1-acyl-sn-glycerol-3-phosphate acyltransferase
MKQTFKLARHIWWVISVRFCFAVFGVGALLLGFLILPLVRILTLKKEQKDLNAQHTVSLSFRLFIRLIASTGVAKFSEQNFERLKDGQGNLIVANHPTLIDYVFIVSRLKHCYTLYKVGVGTNPFMKMVVKMTGYVSNADPEQAMKEVQSILKKGHHLLMFPEGTRTTPGQPLTLLRGAANIALRINAPVRTLHIHCKPAFLTKQWKWYTAPSKKVDFRVCVGELIDTSAFIQTGVPVSRAARRLTETIKQRIERM